MFLDPSADCGGHGEVSKDSVLLLTTRCRLQRSDCDKSGFPPFPWMDYEKFGPFVVVLCHFVAFFFAALCDSFETHCHHLVVNFLPLCGSFVSLRDHFMSLN